MRFIILLLSLLSSFTFAVDNVDFDKRISQMKQAGQLKLKDNLDRRDGYCIDIVGSGEYIRFDLPLTGHNCKESPGYPLYFDEAVIIDGEYIKFPLYQACLTAFGLNEKVLPKTSVLPRACNEESPFLKAKNQQLWKFLEDGKVQLKNTNLCLTVGEDSNSTFDENHRFRSLYLDKCDIVKNELAQWFFYQPLKGKDLENYIDKMTKN